MTSCGDSPESVAEDMLDVFKEVTEIVEGVNDGDDASDAIEDINDLKDEVKEIEERAEAIGKDWSDEEKRRTTRCLRRNSVKKLRRLWGI
jgi:hypothetical protein